MPRLQVRISHRFQNALGQYRIKIADADAFAIQLLQEALNSVGQECLLHRRLQRGEFLLLLNLDGSLFERHYHPRTHPNLERETGIEPATNSLEGCDSTTELLPLKTSSQLSAVSNPSG